MPDDDAPHGRLRVLIVDDDLLVRRALARTLRRDDGVLVDHVGTADEALARFREQRIDLAILDLQMPDVSGVELAEKMRAVRADARILFVTADPSSYLASQARAMVNEGVLPKPWPAEELLRIVRAARSAE